MLVGKAWACVLLLFLLPVAAADTVVYAGYDDGTTRFCAAVGDGGASLASDECSGSATPVHLVGEVSAGARVGGVSACVLIDEDGELHPNCDACAILDRTVGVERSRLADLAQLAELHCESGST